jgi:hypothetical protein
MERLDSPVGITTGYGPDDQGFIVRVPLGEIIFTGTHTPSYPMGNGCSFPRGKVTGAGN